MMVLRCVHLAPVMKQKKSSLAIQSFNQAAKHNNGFPKSIFNILAMQGTDRIQVLGTDRDHLLVRDEHGEEHL